MFSHTFKTNFSSFESDLLVEKIKQTSYDQIIVLTGIGKYLGNVTPDLIKIIKKIGGPDLGELINSYIARRIDLLTIEHEPLLLIGRKGLCKENGLYILNNISKSKCFPFDNVDFENDLNLSIEKQGSLKYTKYSIIKASLNLENDNRFNFNSPTIINVAPDNGPLYGGVEVKINGLNFGITTLGIHSILIKEVICGDIQLLSPNMITCITRPSLFIGPGPGSAVINLSNGLKFQ